MAKKKRKTPISDAEYKRRLKLSRKFNSYSFDLRNKLTPARKAAISRQWNKNKNVYTTIEEQATRATPTGPKWAFLKAPTRGKKKKLSAVTSFTTNKGAFFSVKHSVDDPQKALNSWKFNEQGDLEIKVKQRRQIVVDIDHKTFVGKSNKQQQRILINILKKYGLDNPLEAPNWSVTFYLEGNEIESPKSLDTFLEEWERNYSKGARENNLPITGINFYTFET